MSTTVRLSIEEYEHTASLGAFDGRNHRRVELIRGELRDMRPINPPHATLVRRLSRWSEIVVTGRGFEVSTQQPVRLLDSGSMPEPDVAWVREKDYLKAHPAAEDVLLIIEVADSSLTFDRSDKAEIYASAGIQDYWIVNVPDRSIEVRRGPQGQQYLELQILHRGDEISPISLPEARLNIAELFKEFS